jgi:hypothetical protein
MKKINLNILKEGNIPVGVECSYISICGMRRKLCVEHEAEYSCAAARFYNVLFEKSNLVLEDVINLNHEIIKLFLLEEKL